MLEDVEGEHAVIAARPEGTHDVAVEVERDRLGQARVRRRDHVGRGDVINPTCELGAENAAACAEVRDAPVRRPRAREDLVVQGVLGLLDPVAALVKGAEVELGLVEDACTARDAPWRPI